MIASSAGRRAGTFTFLLLYVAYMVSYVDRSAIALALSQIGKEFHLGTTEFGIILSSFYLGYALMQLPGGWLADRYGSKYVVITTILTWTLFTLTTGFAWSLMSLIAIRFIFGLAEGGFPAASLKGVAEAYSGDARPKMTTMLMSSNYVGSFLAPLLIAPLLIYLGWRSSFMAIGAIGALLAVVYAVVVPYRRPAVTGAPRDRAASRAAMRELFRTPLLWQLLVVWFGLSCVNKGLDAWMPLYLLQARGLDLKSVGLLTPLPFVMASIATAIGGWLMIRYFNGREKYLLIGSSVLTGLFLFLMSTAPTITGVIAFQSLVYFFKSFVFAASFALPAKFLKDEQIGTGCGLVNLGGQCAGFVAPAVIGLLVTQFGTYDAAFDFLLGCTTLAAIVAMTIRTVASVPVPQDA